MGAKTDADWQFVMDHAKDTPHVKALVEAAQAVLEGDDPCPTCGEDPGEGEGLCSEGCARNALVIALRPFDTEAGPDCLCGLFDPPGVHWPLCKASKTEGGECQ